ncbi:hypothetical protein FHL15_004037 [Xylaria flabelliformis]|uniref:Uncharacterized protein n=1 Tax=Xylaria flabelliformis TaxID=2512241 RepID=A0A553I428_9PEZI|nr:hypothetical protein FHL15_004037 [Xylaria flabelliformis]
MNFLAWGCGDQVVPGKLKTCGTASMDGPLNVARVPRFYIRRTLFARAERVTSISTTQVVDIGSVGHDVYVNQQWIMVLGCGICAWYALRIGSRASVRARDDLSRSRSAMTDVRLNGSVLAPKVNSTPAPDEEATDCCASALQHRQGHGLDVWKDEVSMEHAWNVIRLEKARDTRSVTIAYFSTYLKRHSHPRATLGLDPAPSCGKVHQPTFTVLAYASRAKARPTQLINNFKRPPNPLPQ